MPAVERRQRHEVRQTDEHRHERQEVQDGAPVARPSPSDRPPGRSRPRSSGPACSACASVNNSVNTRPIPEGPKTCADLMERLADRGAHLFHAPDHGRQRADLAPDPGRSPIRPIVWPAIVSDSGVIVRREGLAVALDRERDGLADVRRRVRRAARSRVGSATSPDTHDAIPGREARQRAAGLGRRSGCVATLAMYGVGVRGSPKKNSQLANKIAATMKCEPGSGEDHQRALPDGLRAVAARQVLGRHGLVRVHPRDLHVAAERQRLHAVLDVVPLERPEARSEADEVLLDLEPVMRARPGSARPRGSR